MSHKALVIGHRGSPRRERENTRASFERALEEGAHGFETDLRQLGDGALVLHHDGIAAGRRVEELEVEALQEALGYVPESLDALADVGSGSLRILEIKKHGWERELLEVVGAWPQIVISSFDHRVLPACRRLGWDGPLGAVLAGAIIEEASYLEGIGASWFFPQIEFVDAAMVERCGAKGIAVMPWTVNYPAEAVRVAGWGCAGIITDDPSMMRAALEEAGF